MKIIASLLPTGTIEPAISEEYVVDQRDEVRPVEQVQARLCHLLKETPVSISALRPENVGRPRLSFN